MKTAAAFLNLSSNVVRNTCYPPESSECPEVPPLIALSNPLIALKQPSYSIEKMFLNPKVTWVLRSETVR